MRISDWSSDVCSSDLRVLSSRDRFTAFRQRRAIVKVRTVKLGGNGFEGAKAHLRYVERDGTTREGGRGQLYSADSDAVDRKAWLEPAKGDRHQFRFIVSEIGRESGGKECDSTCRSRWQTYH